MSERLDVALVARGLARSRTHAARRVVAGEVTVDGVIERKAGRRIEASHVLEVTGDDHWVSRAAGKLLAALAAFDVDPAGRHALDVGASTGGFTQVLLERGAAHVVALDVGHDQFALPLDDRVTLLEGVNVRELGPLDPRPDLVVADVSFISLSLVLPPVHATVTEEADWIVLVKPQFEVGRGGVRDGIVVDRERRRRAVLDVLGHAWGIGLGTAGLVASPVVGTHGNREYLAHLRAGAGHPTEWTTTAARLTEEAG